MLHSVNWKLVTEVSGQVIGPIFKGRTVPTMEKIQTA
jgi:hypothetical protein